MTLSSALGYVHFARNRGRDYLDSMRPWVQVALLGSAVTRYLGWSTEQAIWAGVIVLALSEVAMLACGVFDHRTGVIRAQQRLNNEQDPYRMEMLARAERIEAELTRLREWATRTGA
jgi:hypothetical protein